MSLFTPLRRSLRYQTSSLARCLEVTYRNTAFRVTVCRSHQNFHVVQGRPNYYLSLKKAAMGTLPPLAPEGFTFRGFFQKNADESIDRYLHPRAT